MFFLLLFILQAEARAQETTSNDFTELFKSHDNGLRLSRGDSGAAIPIKRNVWIDKDGNIIDSLFSKDNPPFEGAESIEITEYYILNSSNKGGFSPNRTSHENWMRRVAEENNREVPELSTAILSLLLGLLMIYFMRRKKKAIA